MNNSKRLKEIDGYLKRLRDIAKENNNFYFTPSHVYHEITRYNVPLAERRYPVGEKEFPKWIERYQDNPNINVYVQENWKYFCQFVPKDFQKQVYLMNQTNLIKLYIPEDVNHIYEAANQIFDFISRSGIAPIAKIGSEIRGDDIVIRVSTEEEAKKIIDFVKHNAYIQEGLIPTNPFLVNESGVGIAWDGVLSYHDMISILVSDYINHRKKENQLNSVSVSDFYSYVNSIRESIFANSMNAEELYQKNPLFASRGLFEPSIKESSDLYSLKGFLESFQLSLQPDYQIEDYYNMCHQLNDLDQFFLQRRKKSLVDEDNIQFGRMGYYALIKHFHSKKQAICNFKEYARTGNVEYLPASVRKTYQNHQFHLQLKDYLIGKDMTLDQYLDQVDPKKSVKNVSAMMRFIDQVMTQKYGEESSFQNIQEYIYSGDSTYITRQYELRDFLNSTRFQNQVLTYLDERGITIADFINQIRGHQLSKEAYLEDACRCNFFKFEEKDKSGIQSVTGAIQRLMDENNYVGFTRELDARKNLAEHVSNQDVYRLVAQRIGIPVDTLIHCSTAERENYCRKYATALLEEYKEINHTL